jgi:hypothetical protein
VTTGDQIANINLNTREVKYQTIKAPLSRATKSPILKIGGGKLKHKSPLRPKKQNIEADADEHIMS